MAFSLDGASYVRAPVTYQGPVTIDVWVKAANNNSPQYASAISSADSPGSLDFQLNTDGVSQWLLYIGGGVQNFGLLDNTVFQHLAFTYDGTTIQAYFQGKPVDMLAWPNEGPRFTTLKIGVNRNGDYPLAGAVDEVHLWNRALSAAEIADLYNNAKGDLCP